MEEVTSRVTGKEKGCDQFQKELQRQMDCKLDRRELGAFQQQQEERWKSLSGQLQEKALKPERDNAAGIRKEWTGECRYPTVPRSCGGPHTVTPPRFQPKPPSTPPPSQPSARHKKYVMQLSGQYSTDGNRQDKQLSMMGASQLSAMPRATPVTSTSGNRPSMALSGHRGAEDTLLSGGTGTASPLLSALLKNRPASSPGHLILPPKLRLPPIQSPRSEPTP
ncbi:hypothetical protein Q9966_006299 [Columba livia]|nr:hypothetical protein Q9966_006299 [Columba livia]